MQRAKTFFYVSLGFLALAGAFALGAQTAQGQAGAEITAFSWRGNLIAPLWAGDDAGRLYGTQEWNQPWQYYHQFPAPIVGMEPQGAFHVILSNGDVYIPHSSIAPDGEWFVINNIFGGAPVQATETTWGRVKAERR